MSKQKKEHKSANPSTSYHKEVDPYGISAGLPPDVQKRCMEDHVFRFATIANNYEILNGTLQELRAGARELHKRGENLIDEAEVFDAAERFCPNGHLATFMHGVSKDRSIAHVLRMMHKQVCAEFIGHRFTVKRELTQHLLNTHVKGVKTNMFRLPFPLIYVRLPRGLNLYIKDYRGEDYEIEGFYANNVTFTADRSVRISIIGASRPIDVLDDASLDFLITLPDGMFISEAFEKGKAKWLTENAGMPHEWFIKSAYIIWELLVNIILYISCANADISKQVNPEWTKLRARINTLPKVSKKREKLKAKLRSTPKNEVIVLGANISATGRGAQHSAQQGHTQRGAVLKHDVRGHWRQVWRGSASPEKQEALGERRKVLKWIEPYTKGADLAEAIKRKTYQVGKR